MAENHVERLERIKVFSPFMTHGGGELATLTKEDFEWIVEQAEATQKMWEVANERGSHMSFLSTENLKLRKALEFYADSENYDLSRGGLYPEYDYIHIVDQDQGEKARKSLEK